MTDTTPEPDNEPLGPMLRRLRKLSGLSQAMVGQAVGVTQQACALWESGTVPPADKLEALERLYKRPADSLRRKAYGPLDDATQARLERLDERVTWIEGWIAGRD